MDFLGNEELLAERWSYEKNLRENLRFKLPEKYYFKWSPVFPMLLGKKIEFTVLPLGNGPIYNSSNVSNNAGWKIDDQLFTFVAEKDIWEVVKRIITQRKKKELEPMLRVLDEVSGVEGDDANAEEFRKMVREIKLFSNKADSTLDRLVKADSNWFVGTFLKMIK